MIFQDIINLGQNESIFGCIHKIRSYVKMMSDFIFVVATILLKPKIKLRVQFIQVEKLFFL
ncbi:hypothetical protein BCD67_00515 [Oscillatoriales cyanobacterium USR001]|nr:hypothetical protein BCD67_00515 [Oscillatoriales cyanobacterium USR001]